MKCTAVIAEFHPYHNGHRYLREQAASLSHADYMIAVMSGNFTQRGSVALWNKYTRASMAVSDGFDLVLELPFVYATGSAGDFAEGAVSMLDRLGCIDTLAFGVEDDQPELFDRIVNVLTDEPEAYRMLLRQALASGMSYPKARQTALSSVCGDDTGALLEKPNNTLAVSYLCALKKRNASVKPLFVKRVSSDYHDIELKNSVSSASALRAALSNGTFPQSLTDQFPASVIPYLQTPDGTYLSDSALTPFVQAHLLQPESLRIICDMPAALINKLKHIHPASDYDTIVDSLKSKDLTRSRIARALLHALVQYTEDDRRAFLADSVCYYANLLAMKKDSGALVRALHENSRIPVITKKADFARILSAYPTDFSDLAARMWSLDLRASKLHACLVYNRYGVAEPTDCRTVLPILK